MIPYLILQELRIYLSDLGQAIYEQGRHTFARRAF